MKIINFTIGSNIKPYFIQTRNVIFYVIALTLGNPRENII